MPLEIITPTKVPVSHKKIARQVNGRLRLIAEDRIPDRILNADEYERAQILLDEIGQTYRTGGVSDVLTWLMYRNRHDTSFSRLFGIEVPQLLKMEYGTPVLAYHNSKPDKIWSNGGGYTGVLIYYQLKRKFEPRNYVDQKNCTSAKNFAGLLKDITSITYKPYFNGHPQPGYRSRLFSVPIKELTDYFQGFYPRAFIDSAFKQFEYDGFLSVVKTLNRNVKIYAVNTKFIYALNNNLLDITGKPQKEYARLLKHTKNNPHPDAKYYSAFNGITCLDKTFAPYNGDESFYLSAEFEKFLHDKKVDETDTEIRPNGTAFIEKLIRATQSK